MVLRDFWKELRSTINNERDHIFLSCSVMGKRLGEKTVMSGVRVQLNYNEP